MRASCESYAAKDAKAQIAPVTRAPARSSQGRKTARRVRSTSGVQRRRCFGGQTTAAGDPRVPPAEEERRASWGHKAAQKTGSGRGRVLSAASGSAPGARGDAVGFWEGSEAASAFLVREPQLVLCTLSLTATRRCAQHASGVGRGCQTQTKTYMYISSAACAAAACS